MGRTFGVFVTVLALVGASFAVSVSVSSPAANATVASPVTIKASASSTHPITGWHIYVDGSNAYSGGATQTISAPVTLSTGTHQLIVRAWDSSGAYGSYNMQLTAGATAAPSPSTGVTVSVTSPANNTTASSPVTFSASANSSYAITGWRIYVDGVSAYVGGPVNTISTPVTMTSGTHQVIVRAWNTANVYGSQNLTVNVSAGSTAPPPSPGGPTPPANAVVYSKLEEATGWGSCRSSSCSGSSNPATYWMAQYQTTPSVDGASTEFYASGSAWADILWWKHVTPVATATHYLLDYWVKPNSDTLTHAIALEYDFVHIVSGRKYDFSNQCHYSGTPHWDTWDGANLTWIHSNIPCPKLDPNTWHHIKIYAERVGTQTHNISYTVDGVTYQVPTQYAWHGTRTSTSSNSQNIQVQMDTNAYAGTVSEYLDQVTLYLW